jgi:hypothetical protein
MMSPDDWAKMKNMKATLFALSALVATTLPLSAYGETCIPRYSSAFASLEGKVYQAGTQAGADAAIEELFGPRPQTCEDGAYELFLTRYEEFASLAVRKGSPKKKAEQNENYLRLAIAAIRKGPMRINAKDAKAMQHNLKQVKSNVNARADEYGSKEGPTPMMLSLLGAIGNTLEPQVITEAPPLPPGGNPNNVQQIRIPLQPMPDWAIVKLYEIRDHAKNGDVAAVQIKLQDVINWVEQTTQPR